MEGPLDFRTRLGICIGAWLMAGLGLLAWHPEPPGWAYVVAVLIGPAVGYFYARDSGSGEEDMW